MKKDQVKGRVKEAEGMVKEITGKLVVNTELEEKGKLEKTVGKVQAGFGDVRQDIKKL